MRSVRDGIAVLAALIAAAAAGCGGRDAAPSSGALLAQPADLVGRWVQLREDSTWGDTLEYRADGRVRGSAGQAVPSSARWGVSAGPGVLRGGRRRRLLPDLPL